MPVSAPADKRFRRAHVRPTRQTPWRKRTVRLAAALIVGLVLAFGVFEAVGYALSSKPLRIRRISVSGNMRMSSGEVRALLRDLVGASVVTADLEASRRKLLASPWVAEAEVRRIFPGAIAVAIAERRPIAVGRLGADLRLIDQTGTIIDPPEPVYAQFDLPIVNGLISGSTDGILIDQQRAALTARVLSALQARGELANRVSEIDVSDARDAALILKNDTVLVHVGTEKFVERLQSYLELAPTLRDRVADIDYVDLRYVPRIFVGSRHPEHTVQERGGRK
jgi:cell division protein FtsQ